MPQCKCGNYGLEFVRKLDIVDISGQKIGVVTIYHCPKCNKNLGIEQKCVKIKAQ